MDKKIFREVRYENKNYMYTAKLSNGTTIIAFEDATAIGDDLKHYRLRSHIDYCEYWDVLNEVIVDGCEKTD